MEKFYITGSIYQASHEEMDDFIRTLLGDTKTKIRLFGFAIIYEVENFRFYLDTSYNDGRVWSITAYFDGSLNELNGFVTKFTKAFIEADFNYSFAYIPIDDDLEDIGEEVDFEHPDFDKRYIPLPSDG